MNKWIGIGRLTKDVDFRMTNTGVAVANFTIAINRPFLQNGERQTDYINCVTWRKQAENLSTYVKKGDQVAVEGMIQTRSYEGKDGKRVYVTEVMAESIQFLETKGQSQNKKPQRQSNDNPFQEQPIQENLPF